MKAVYKSIYFTLLFVLITVVGHGQAVPASSDSVLLAGNNITAVSTLQFTYNNSAQNTAVVGSLQTVDANFGPSDVPRWGGQNLRLGAVFGNSALSGGNPGIVNGVGFEKVYFGGVLTIDAETLTYPVRYGRNLIIFTRPARLHGTLYGYSAPPNVQPTTPIFANSIDIQGEVTITLRATALINNGARIVPNYSIKSIVYAFANSGSSRSLPKN